MRAPFELTRYFYTSTFVAANKEFRPESFVMPDIEVKSDTAQNPDNPDIWNVSLHVGLAENADPKTTPYKFGLSIFGVFFCKFSEDFSPENLLKCKRLFYVNASSMLFSAARDHLLTLTTLGPYGPFMLPTHRFNPEDLKSETPA